MSKEKELKKLLIKTGASATVALVVVLGLAYFLSGYDDDVRQKEAQQRSQNTSIGGEYHEIETTLGIGNEILKYHDEYSKTHNDGLIINRENITNTLSELRRKNHLADRIEVTVSPVTDVPENNVTTKSGKLAKSTVSIKIAALTDTSIYNFIYDLQHKLPGFVVVYDLKIKRAELLSRNVVVSVVSQHVIPPMVTGELSFVWLGVIPSAKEEGSK